MKKADLIVKGNIIVNNILQNGGGVILFGQEIDEYEKDKSIVIEGDIDIDGIMAIGDKSIACTGYFILKGEVHDGGI